VSKLWLIPLACVVLVAAAGPAAVAAAQETRQDVIATAQAEKALDLHPYEAGKAEAILSRAGAALSSLPTGLYPWFGSVFRGGLLAIGPGYRQPLGDDGAFDAQAAWSLRGYKLGRATLTLPSALSGRVHTAVSAEIIDATNVAFYGIGERSDRDDPARFLYRPTTVGGLVSIDATPWLNVGGSLHLLNVTTGAGRSDSIESTYTAEDAPGLGASPDYVVSHLYTAVDWRDSPGYSRRGGYYRVDWRDYAERTGHGLAFQQVDALVTQLIPILRENWVIALRAAATTTTTDTGHEVPYFLLPSVGGSAELRAFPSWRFRDRHRLLLSAEYRWTPSHFLDMAVFYDAGKVTARRSDLDLSGLERSVGIGARVHAPNATLLRLELARGSEGLRFIMTFGAPF
jgi:hypothetical protein